MRSHFKAHFGIHQRPVKFNRKVSPSTLYIDISQFILLKRVRFYAILRELLPPSKSSLWLRRYSLSFHCDEVLGPYSCAKSCSSGDFRPSNRKSNYFIYIHLYSGILKNIHSLYKTFLFYKGDQYIYYLSLR